MQNLTFHIIGDEELLRQLINFASAEQNWPPPDLGQIPRNQKPLTECTLHPTQIMLHVLGIFQPLIFSIFHRIMCFLSYLNCIKSGARVSNFNDSRFWLSFPIVRHDHGTIRGFWGFMLLCVDSLHRNRTVFPWHEVKFHYFFGGWHCVGRFLFLSTSEGKRFIPFSRLNIADTA